MAHLLNNTALGLLMTAVLTGITTGVDAPASAEQQPKVVIELFTSQGCSSCPPADKLLGQLASGKDIIALTFPVDYWDYLGWKDTLASPAYTARQRAYARARGDGQVYTPQVVIDGAYHAVGSRAWEIERTIAKSRKNLNRPRIPLTVRTEGGTLVITAGAAPDGARVKPATIWLALVKKSKKVKISRGENGGRSITYHQVVRDLTPVGQWSGREVTIKLPKLHLRNKRTDGCTIFLQQDLAGPILAAVEIQNW